MARDLSILVIGRNEMFMARTVQDLLDKKRGNTEVIVVCDEVMPNPALPIHPDVKFIFNDKPLGQRAATNMAARASDAKYVMKIDAHCAVDEGFDVKMMDQMQDNYTMIPIMYNLHAFDWVCDNCGSRWYQGQTPLECRDSEQDKTKKACGNKTRFHKDITWERRMNRKSEFYRFDTTLHFQYHGDQKKRAGDGILVETMSAQGSCFMLTREKYWELDICDEKHGGWGQQGVEVACKTWLSGGRLVTNRATWYSHMFRTQGGDFGFPYPLSSGQVNRAREYSRALWMENTWKNQIYPLSWLIEKFKPLPDWHEEKGKAVLDYVNRKGREFTKGSPQAYTPSKGIIFYTDSQLDEKIAKPVRDQLLKCSQEKNIPIVSASLKRLDFGRKNIKFPSMKKGYLAMFKQVLAALENSSADIIYFCEHDVLYHPSHFDFTPKDENVYYYNQNVWFLRMPDGHALHYDVNQLSGLCGYREALLTHWRERYEMVLAEFNKGIPDDEFVRFVRNIGFEPMTHNRIDWKNKFKFETWKSEYPNVDIKHGANATGQRWNKDQYRNQNLLVNWSESEEIQGWGKGTDIVKTLQ